MLGDEVVGYREQEYEAVAQQEAPRVVAVCHLYEDVEAVDYADDKCCEAKLRAKGCELLGVYYLGGEGYEEQYARNERQDIC